MDRTDQSRSACTNRIKNLSKSATANNQPEISTIHRERSEEKRFAFDVFINSILSNTNV